MSLRFVDRRVKITRVKDGVVLTGWVQYAGRAGVSVTPNAGMLPSQGDVVWLEVIAEKRLARLDAKVETVGFDCIDFVAIGDWRVQPAPVDGRRRMYGAFMRMVTDTGDQELELLDVSPGGFGFMSPVELPTETPLLFLMGLPQGELSLIGRVQHQQRDADGQWVGGVELVSNERLNKQKWVTFTRQAA